MRHVIIGFGLLILCLLILFKINEVNFIRGNVKLEAIVAIIAFIFFFVGLYFNNQAQKKTVTC
jgi:lipopolysaccharide export LptBFGC system permease protein LptF